MGINKKKMFGTKSAAAPTGDTLIGNMGATITTKTILATYLKAIGGAAFSDANIENFTIDGSDNITCNITADYDLAGVTMGSTGVTYYHDNEDRCKSIFANYFKLSTLAACTFDAVTVVSTGAFWDCDLVELSLPLWSNTATFANWLNSNLLYVSFPSQTSTGSYILGQCDFLTLAEMPLVTEMGSYAFYNCEKLKYYFSDAVTGNLGNYTFALIASDLVVEMPNATSFEDRVCQASSGMTRAYFPKLTTIGVLNFTSCGGLNKLNLASCTTIGTSHSVDDGNFTTIKTGCRIYVDPSMLTINAGGLEADLAYAETTRSCTIVSVSNLTVPSAVSDLSASTITTTGCDLDFSTPSATNTIEWYDVYIKNNDETYPRWVWLQEITLTGDTISGLTTGTSYDIKIKTADEYYNQSVDSNTINITTS